MLSPVSSLGSRRHPKFIVSRVRRIHQIGDQSHLCRLQRILRFDSAPCALSLFPFPPSSLAPVPFPPPLHPLRCYPTLSCSQHHEIGSIVSIRFQIDRRFLDSCHGWSMSLPGPNVRVSLDSRYLTWPYLLRDPNPTATTTNCTSEWAYWEWRLQGQRDWTDQQLKLARCQCGQQPWPVAVGSDEPSSTLPSVGRAAGANSKSYWLCT